MATDHLTAAREYFKGRDWIAANTAFEEAVHDGAEVPARDQFDWSMALYWERDLDAAIARLEAAADQARRDDDFSAEALALTAAVQLGSWAEHDAVVTAAATRLGNLLEGVEETEAHAFWEWATARLTAEADLDEGYRQLEGALAMARRVGSRNVEALALTTLSQVDTMQCRGRDAMTKVDAAAALALSGEVIDLVAGAVLCGVVFSCRNAGDWDRAEEWTDIAARWSARAGVSVFPGLCQFHRCEILRVHGDFAGAEHQAELACTELADLAPAGGLGFGYRELGTVRLLRGDEAGADEAFRLALDHGVDPNPGLALLRMRRGEITSARRGLESALELTGTVAFERPFLLPALVTVCLADGDTDAASLAAAELSTLATQFGTAPHLAATDQADAEVALAKEDLESARNAARSAWKGWTSLRAPYEAARAQETLSGVELAAGARDAAVFELENARRGYERIGAFPDVARIDQALRAAGGDTETPQSRAFMFTDIVDSTPLQRALGDDRWLPLLEWHDQSLRAAFDEFGGEVVKHEGDGFFVSFPSGFDALRAGCRIQQTLARHRTEAGFALDVRIGVHEGTATPRDGDWIGANVTMAARVAGAAAGGEVVCTDAVLASAPTARVAERRSLDLKGIDGIVDANLIEACR